MHARFPNMPRTSATGITAALAALLLSTAMPATAKAEPQPVPSTRITLEVPSGFTPAKQFPGFMNETTGASVVVMQMPAEAFTEFKANSLAEKLKSQGFANVKDGKLKRSSEHLYITAEQATAVGAFSKFLLIFADPAETAMLTVNVPKADIESGKTKVADIEKMLETAKFAATTAAETEADFILGYVGPFKKAGGMLGATMYTLDGKTTPDKLTPGRPLFIVTSSINATEIEDLASTSRVALTSMFDLEAGRIVKQGPLTISGLEGYEIEFAAPDKKGEANVGYQAFLKRAGGGYVRMVGTAGEAEGKAGANDLVAEFRKMAASYALKPTP